MKGQEIDERSIGLVTVGIDGLWPRLRLAASLLFTGQATFGILPENFIEEGVRPDGTTCIYRADPEDDHVCIGDPPDLSQGGAEKAWQEVKDAGVD